MKITATLPIIYHFRSTADSFDLQIEAANMGDAFDQLPNLDYAFVRAIDADGDPIFG